MISLLSSSSLVKRSLPILNLLSLLPGRFSSAAVGSSPARRSPLRSSMAFSRPASPSSLAALDSEVGLTKKLWIKSRRELLFAMYTPFTVCLSSGNVKVETFRHYIAQDVYFLKAFAQAYELAEECADDDDAKVAITELRKEVLEQLKMHDSFVQEWGSENTRSPETVRAPLPRHLRPLPPPQQPSHLRPPRGPATSP